jgi:predicted PhzF superfamily epimerase YddE/YHI9
MTAVDVDVLRVFVDPAGRFGNPLGIVDGYDASVLQVPAGEVSVIRSGEVTSVRAHADWAAPSSGTSWKVRPPCWRSTRRRTRPTTTTSGPGAMRLRARSARACSAPAMGVIEDEATGSAAVTLTNQLGRDLLITQGAGSQLITTYEGGGWATVGGRVTHETTRTLNLP